MSAHADWLATHGLEPVAKAWSDRAREAAKRARRKKGSSTPDKPPTKEELRRQRQKRAKRRAAATAVGVLGTGAIVTTLAGNPNLVDTITQGTVRTVIDPGNVPRSAGAARDAVGATRNEVRRNRGNPKYRKSPGDAYVDNYRQAKAQRNMAVDTRAKLSRAGAYDKKVKK